MSMTAQTTPGRTARRREQFLAAAADLFARRGFRGVSIYDIGSEVGVSGPALYRHFPNKEAMLAELLTDTSYRLLSVAQDRVANTDPGTPTLSSLISWHVDFALDNPALITIQARDLECLRDDEGRQIRRLQRQYVEVWTETIRQIRPGIVNSLARSVTHSVFGLINSTPHSVRMDREDIRVLLHDMALAALLRGIEG